MFPLQYDETIKQITRKFCGNSSNALRGITLFSAKVGRRGLVRLQLPRFAASARAAFYVDVLATYLPTVQVWTLWGQSAPNTDSCLVAIYSYNEAFAATER